MSLPRVLPHIALGEDRDGSVGGRRALLLLDTPPRVVPVHFKLQPQTAAPHRRLPRRPSAALLLPQQLELQAAHFRVAEAHVEGVVGVGETHRVAKVHRPRHTKVFRRRRRLRKGGPTLVKLRPRGRVKRVLLHRRAVAPPTAAARSPSGAAAEARPSLLGSLPRRALHLRHLRLHRRRFLFAAHLNVQRPEVLVQGVLPGGDARDIVHEIVVA
mmetsp:Transcript_7051/g.12794  ORF Transcript_7051/g.12794 Transcript_7051/m.12794 type:complete len:214 (-) Transcript_7051:1054-1695(-)